jgi:hypothetical protein
MWRDGERWWRSRNISGHLDPEQGNRVVILIADVL